MMRHHTTYHQHCIRERKRFSSTERLLDVNYLTRLLQYNKDGASGQGVSNRANKGNKRAASSDIIESSKPRRKRFKKKEDQDASDVESESQAEEPSSVQVYRHSIDVQYTKTASDSRRKLVVHEAVAEERGWPDEEERLVSLVQAATAGHSSVRATSVDVGSLDLRLQGGNIQAFIDGRFLLDVPSVDPEFSIQDNDIRTAYLGDPLVACLVLEEAGRAEVNAHLKLVHDPSRTAEDATVLHLVIEFAVALIRPAIFEPFLYTTKTAMSQAEDAQRRALCYMFPSNKPDCGDGRKKADIPLLYSVMRPAPPVNAPATEAVFQPPALVPTLLPFQRRTVAWLLSREGKYMNSNGDVVDLEDTPFGAKTLPIFWQNVKISDSDEWYLNRLTGELAPEKPHDASPPAGILAEEPGLGKTLESIALILLNQAIGRNPTTKSWNSETRIFVKEIKTTLIVTPPSLAQQWVDELKLHAPTLKVLVYEGWAKVHVPITDADLADARALRAAAVKKAKLKKERLRLAANVAGPSNIKGKKGKGKVKAKADDDDDMSEDEDQITDWCNYVNSFDVCITTYTVLQQDLGIARPPPDRPRRSIAVYSNVERPRSPLVMCEWYRVIMDEVQMVGGGNTEEMVSLIPRLSSFAVSGTPARSKVADMIHVLKFLRIDILEKSPRLWNRLLQPGLIAEFTELFHRYAVRTMKASVKHELTIPKQTRYLVPVELGRVERHVYDQNFENALLELGMDARGVAVSENWEINTNTLRFWLRKLRGICTHPQVGQLLNQDKLHKSGVLKTMGEVLEGMRDQNWRNFMDDRKAKVQVLTVLAQLQHDVKGNRGNTQAALEILQKAEAEANQIIADIKAAMAQHEEAGKQLKEQAIKPVGTSENEEPMNVDIIDKGKGKARDESIETDSMDGDEDGLPRNAAGEEHRIKRRALQQRLRECQITLHRVYFLKGDVYHALGDSHTDAENEAYATAEDLRRNLLKSTEHAARRAMAQLLQDAGKKGINEKELYIEVPYCGLGGIRSRDLMEEANEIIDELLNEQASLLWKWRTKLLALLTQSLTADGEDADGQEYARGLETQGEAEAYLQAYANLLADRREIMTSERTLLAALNAKDKKTRKTKAARKAAEAANFDDEVIVQLAAIDTQPEHEVLYKELEDARRELLEDFDPARAMRSVMVDLNNVATRIMNDKDPEKILASEGAVKLRGLISDQAKHMEKLQADLGKFRKAFNERIAYFRQLQEISDTVAEVAWEGARDAAMRQNEAEKIELEAKINTGRARQRYLDHLARAQEDGKLEEDEEVCILCKCDFTRGYITQCAHIFCETCLKAWLGRKEGRACPVCRVAIDSDQLQRFVVNQKPEEPAPPKIVNNEPAPKSRRRIEYNLINPSLLESIHMMESHGSYGSKIQTLVRHLLYIQIVDPGAKSIVFSAWADSLHIIEHALAHNGIPCLRIDQNRGKESAAKQFKAKPELQVLLLHGERENAGLNVTCASRVFLVESVVHHAFEIQAIARIDRMGQTRPTEVYCYYAEETVERNILDLAARQGLSLYTKENSAGTLTAGPITVPGKDSVDAPTKRVQKGDFVFRTDDMLAIFFPHLFEELEFLLPEQEVEQPPATSSQSSIHTNAVAGPSRLL